MSNKLVKEGIIKCTSGKLIIADPCIVQTEVRDIIEELETEHRAASKEYDEVRNTHYERLGRITLGMAEVLGDKALAKEAAILALETFADELRTEDQQYKANLEQAQRKLLKTPRFSIPWLAQGDNFVFYSTRDGDGIYPVIRTPEGIKVCFNFPEDRNGNLDTSRLEGRLLGTSAVDSGILMAFDSTRFDLNGGVSRDSYAEVEAPTGTYSCRYIIRRGQGFLMSKKNKI